MQQLHEVMQHLLVSYLLQEVSPCLLYRDLDSSVSWYVVWIVTGCEHFRFITPGTVDLYPTHQALGSDKEFQGIVCRRYTGGSGLAAVGTLSERVEDFFEEVKCERDGMFVTDVSESIPEVLAPQLPGFFIVWVQVEFNQSLWEHELLEYSHLEARWTPEGGG